MGGCCCCSSKARELSAAPTYYYVYPRTSEQVPLSSRQGGAALSTGLLVDTNLDTSSPDTYRPPPAPIPYDVSVERPRTPPAAQEISGNKSDATLPTTTTSDSGQDAAGDSPQETSAKCEDLKDSDGKAETTLELDPVKKSEKSVEPMALVIDEEDVCPTCLEEYDEENPKITTKCDHHYHLACILEWMERSDTCPVCDQEDDHVDNGEDNFEWDDFQTQEQQRDNANQWRMSIANQMWAEAQANANNVNDAESNQQEGEG